MSRLQKKCVFASAALHGLLLAILLFGPAFLRPHKQPEENRPLLSVIPRTLVDAALASGGEPAAAPAKTIESSQPSAPIAPPTAVPPTAEPIVEPKKATPPKIEKPEPPAEKPLPPKPNTRIKPKQKPEPDESKAVDEIPPKPADRIKPAKTKPEVPLDLKPANRSNDQAAAQKAKADAKAQADAKARAEKAAQAAQAEWQGALGSLRKNLTGPSASIQTLGGAGGESFADYGQVVKKYYTDAWQTPNDVTDEKATVRVEVTIARNGKVIEARITGSSGIRSLDGSVDRALNRVKNLPPFPDGAKDLQRSFELNFNLKAKSSLG